MKNILIVEDEMSQREMMAEYFEYDGYITHTANNGNEALLILEENDIDIVVSDIQMPKMDGLKLIDNILLKKNELPIILITGYGGIEVAINAIKKGAVDFLIKPINFDKLSMIIETNLYVLSGLQKDEELSTFLSGSVRWKWPVSKYFLLDYLTFKVSDMIFQSEFVKRYKKNTIKTVLHAVFSNSLYHGSLELPCEIFNFENSESDVFYNEIKRRVADGQYCEKYISIVVIFEKGKITLVAEDFGKGFSHKEKMAECENINFFGMSKGRGLIMIKGVMGENNYKFNEQGNKITLTFHGEAENEKENITCR